MYRLKTTANFNVGGGVSGEVIHDSTLMGKGTSESPLKVDQSKFAKPSDLSAKQDTLVSGTNIKTINNQSILGTGNITIESSSGEGLSTEVKNAILDCFEHVAWVDEHGQDYYDALSDLFFPPKELVSISAVFNQGQNVIYDNASLDDLKQYLTVTALYDDESTETITNYSLSGTLTAGTSTITVTYQGKTTTFTVNVTAVPTLSSITATYTQSGAVYPSDSLDSLKSDLVVKAIYSDSSEVTLQDSDYTLSGTLTAGTSTITVVYINKSTTFNVTVSQPVELSSITAVYTQSGTVYTSDTLDSLKSDLVVIANYSDSSTRTVTDYTLSGTLAAGTSTITVTYGGKTTTFSVTVTPVVVTSIDAVFTQGSATITTNNSLDDLKQYLVVTATYNNGTTSTVASTDYTLSGTLEVGTSTITVTYEGVTDTFDVTVTAPIQWDFEWYATSGALPTGMTHNGVTWGAGNSYADIKTPTYTVDYGNIEWEIELAWLSQDESETSTANTQMLAASRSGYAVKVYRRQGVNQAIFVGKGEGGATTSTYEIAVDITEFHTYRMKLEGTTATFSIDGTQVAQKEVYSSQYNGTQIIYSGRLGSNTIALKSIKWRR